MTNEGGTAGYSPSLELRNSVVQETGFLYFVPDTLELRISRHCVVAPCMRREPSSGVPGS